MADFFFFTEPLKLNTQTDTQAFGTIDENSYRIGNMFSISSDAKAFAVTEGLVLVQQIGTTDKYNIILKPSSQPDLNLPKINYIVYKGIKKSSIIDDSKVAASTNNALTKVIHDNAAKWYASEELPIPSSEPSVNTSLGLEYSASNPDANFAIQDSETLDTVFYSIDDITLPFVNAGDHIGDFDSSGEIGILILFEKIGYRPTFKLSRELDSLLTYNPLSSSATNTDIFMRKDEKENSLAFIDSAAFFGAFNGLGLQVYDGTDFVRKNGDDLYNEVIKTHFNKNVIYLDIRNETDDSFNYYENYGNNVKWSLDNSENLTSIDYYRNNGWPLLVISTDEFSVDNINKVIKTSVPRGDNEIPLLYYKRAFKNNLGFELPSAEKQFLVPTIVEDEVVYEDLVPFVTEGKVNANYFQLRNIRRVNYNEDPADNFPTEGLSIFQNGYLDGVFPIFDMVIPFDDSTGKSYSKIYYDVGFIDKKNINGSQYTSNLGIGKDNLITTFISYPSKYHLNIQQNNDEKIPLSGFEGPSSSLFLLELDNQIQSIKIVKSEFEISGITQEYLRFEKQSSLLNKSSIDVYSFEDVSILALTNQQFQDLEQLKNQEFANGYKIHLGIDNIVVGTDDIGETFTKFDYVLRGLKDDGNGNVIRHTATPSTPITVYTNEKILEVDYVRNYEEAIGYDNFQDSPSNTIRYEDYFIDLQSGIKKIVNDFIEELYNSDSASSLFFEAVKSLVAITGRTLYSTAVNIVQANSNNPDDRPLYWARLKMAVAIKSHPSFRGDLDASGRVFENSNLSEVITLFEESSRNYSGISFANAPSGAKKILITGFDPFFLTPGVANNNILQSNPSGVVALSLHETTTLNGQGFTQTMIVPVRYSDFDGFNNSSAGQGEGIIEDYIKEWVGEVDMIITVSQSGPDNYNIDVFGTATRGGAVDNMNFTRVGNTKSVSSSSVETFVTTLPDEFTQNPSEAIFDGDYLETEQDAIDFFNGDTSKLKNSSTTNYPVNKVYYVTRRKLSFK